MKENYKQPGNKRTITGRWRGLSLVSDTAGVGESGTASTPFGPVRAGLTNMQTTQIRQLTELLNSLERDLQSFNSKYCEAYVTLVSVMEHLVKLIAITKDTGGTDTLKA